MKKLTILLPLFLIAISLQAQERKDTTLMREISINGQRQRISIARALLLNPDAVKLTASSALTTRFIISAPR